MFLIYLSHSLLFFEQLLTPLIRLMARAAFTPPQGMSSPTLYLFPQVQNTRRLKFLQAKKREIYGRSAQGSSWVDLKAMTHIDCVQ